LALAAAATLLAATSATAAGPPTFPTGKVFFHCAATKVGNVGAADGALPSWNATAPTASVQTGAGCGSTNAPVVGGTTHAGLYDAVWAGTHTGNIKELTVELHSIYAGAARAMGAFGVAIEVGIDGVIYKPTATNGVIRATPVPSSTRASEKVLVSLTGFNVVDDRDRDGVADEGPGTKLHQITVKVRNGFIDANPVGAFVYDSTEVPSGVTFNPATIEPASSSVTS